MKRFTDAIRSAVEAKNWYGALTIALMLPDVCGRLETPGESSTRRYVRWFNEWMLPTYTVQVGGIAHLFLTGEDCYALRCSFLHAGSSEISEQRIQKALTDFHFITPPSWGTAHRNQIGSVLQLQVDIFALEIAEIVDKWCVEKAADATLQERMAGLLKIHDPSGGIPGMIVMG